MSYFGLNAVNQNQQLDEAVSNPAGFKRSDAGFFDNAIGAGIDGLYSGLVAKPDQALWGAVDAVVSPVARFVNDTLGVNDTSAEFAAEQRKLAQQQVGRITPSAGTTGTAGQVLYGLFDMGSQAVAGTLFGGPIGGAAAVSGLQGFSEFEHLRAQGVDLSTAQDVALVHGVTAGAGTLIPMSIGLRAGGVLAEGVGSQIARTGESALRNATAAAARAAPDIAYAAGTNVAMGMALRGITSSVLSERGYDDMAAQYRVFDSQALAIDAVLGVAFGGVGRFINSRGEAVNTPEFSRSDIDAALTANIAQHAEIHTAPGIPINVLSRNAHAQALQKAMRDLSEGQPVDVATLADQALFADIPGRRSLIAQSLDEALMAADEGSAALTVATRALEEQAAQLLSRGDRKVYQSEIANSQRIINSLNEERSSILSEQPVGSGKKLAAARADKQQRLRGVDQKLREAEGRLEFSRSALAPHEPGGQFFEARAELTRRQQAESELNTQALSFYRTPDIAAPADNTAPAQAQPHTQAGSPARSDVDIADRDSAYAEEALASSPDMLVTIIDDDGNPQSRSARELFDEASRESKQAAQDSSLFDVAVNCFLRG